MSDLFVGVDGGGTHTRARLRDVTGRLLGEGIAAGSNLELGIEQAKGEVMAAIDGALTEAGLGPHDYGRLHAGLALASAELPHCFHAFLAEPLPFAEVRLTSDAFGACLGAFGGNEGAILIAGTGSVGLIYRHGAIQTCSGRGFPISDLGSGAWLGLRALQSALLSHDGILPPSLLAVRVMDHFGRDQVEAVRWASQAIPADYGRFAPWVIEAARDGDELAQALEEELLGTLTLLLHGMHRLGAPAIALLGGIGTALAPRLAQRCPDLLVSPRADALEGALLFIKNKELPCLHP